MKKTALFAETPLVFCSLSCKNYSVCTSLLKDTESQSGLQQVLSNSTWSLSLVSNNVCISIKTKHLPSSFFCTTIALDRSTVQGKSLAARTVETRLSSPAPDKLCSQVANRLRALCATCAPYSQLSFHSGPIIHPCIGPSFLTGLESNRARDTGLTPEPKRARAGDSESMDTKLVFQQQQERIEGEPLNLTKSFGRAATEPEGSSSPAPNAVHDGENVALSFGTAVGDSGLMLGAFGGGGPEVGGVGAPVSTSAKIVQQQSL
jgi:hypothetical protein